MDFLSLKAARGSFYTLFSPKCNCGLWSMQRNRCSITCLNATTLKCRVLAALGCFLIWWNDTYEVCFVSFLPRSPFSFSSHTHTHSAHPSLMYRPSVLVAQPASKAHTLLVRKDHSVTLPCEAPLSGSNRTLLPFGLSVRRSWSLAGLCLLELCYLMTHLSQLSELERFPLTGPAGLRSICPGTLLRIRKMWFEALLFLSGSV